MKLEMFSPHGCYHDLFAVRKQLYSKRGSLSVQRQYLKEFKTLRFQAAASPFDIEVYFIDPPKLECAMALLSNAPQDVSWVDAVYYPVDSPHEMLVPTGSIFIRFKNGGKDTESNELQQLFPLRQEEGNPSRNGAYRFKLTEKATIGPTELVGILNERDGVIDACIDVYQPESCSNNGVPLFRSHLNSILSFRWRRRAMILKTVSFCMGIGIISIVFAGFFLFEKSAELAEEDMMSKLERFQKASVQISDNIGRMERSINEIAGELTSFTGTKEQDRVLKRLGEEVLELDNPIRREGFLIETDLSNGDGHKETKLSSPVVNWTWSTFRKVISGDIDNDSDDDLIGLSSTYRYENDNEYYDPIIDIRYSEGNGQFSDPVPIDLVDDTFFQGFNATNEFEGLDINGDGKLDLVTVLTSQDVNNKDRMLAVLTSQGNQVFSGQRYSLPLETRGLNFVLADTNKDQIGDLIITSKQTNSIAILKGKKPAGFLSAEPISIPTKLVDLAVADIDQDGAKDILIAGQKRVYRLELEKDNPVTLMVDSSEHVIRRLFALSLSEKKGYPSLAAVAVNSQGQLLGFEPETVDPSKYQKFKFKLKSRERFFYGNLQHSNINPDGKDVFINLSEAFIAIPIAYKDDMYVFTQHRFVNDGNNILRQPVIGNFSGNKQLEIIALREKMRPEEAVKKAEEAIKNIFNEEIKIFKNESAKEFMNNTDLQTEIADTRQLLEIASIALKKYEKELKNKTNEDNSKVVLKGWVIGTYRFGVLGVMLFLVQILVVTYRYTVKLATFYDSRADALELAGQSSLDEFSLLVESLSPEKMDFGKAPTTPLDNAVEVAKVLSSKVPKK